MVTTSSRVVTLRHLLATLALAANIILAISGVSANSPASSVQTPSAQTGDVLYDQYNSQPNIQPSASGWGTNSTTYIGGYCPATAGGPARQLREAPAADDFVVPTGRTWTVSTVELPVYETVPATETLGVNVVFYRPNESGSLPGTVLTTASNAAVTGRGTGRYSITLSPAVSLQAGSYWVSVQSSANLCTYRWAWGNCTAVVNNPAAKAGPGTPILWQARWVNTNYPDQAFLLRGARTDASAGGGEGAPPRPTASSGGLPGSGTKTFPETKKTITGLFLDYWNSNGKLPQQGFPISDVMGEKSDLNGQVYTVQYFERAVFEYHPEIQDPKYKVLLSQLGTFQYKKKYGTQGAPGQIPDNSAGSRLFPETGKRLGGRFLEYWTQNGGLAQQGLPLSNPVMEKSETNGQTYIVQYFERAVFELHPENAKPNDVLLSLLGVFQYKAKYGGGR